MQTLSGVVVLAVTETTTTTYHASMTSGYVRLANSLERSVQWTLDYPDLDYSDLGN